MIWKLCIVTFVNLFVINTFGYSQTKTLDSLKKSYLKDFDTAYVKNHFDNALYQIKRIDDEFVDKTTFITNILKPISLTKVIINSKTHYYLSLNTKGNTLNYGISGVYILFTDKSKWNRINEKIEVEYDDGYNYSAFIELMPNELKVFQTKRIEKFKLYIHDEDVYSSDAELFMLQSNYIQTMHK